MKSRSGALRRSDRRLRYPSADSVAMPTMRWRDVSIEMRSWRCCTPGSSAGREPDSSRELFFHPDLYPPAPVRDALDRPGALLRVERERLVQDLGRQPPHAAMPVRGGAPLERAQQWAAVARARGAGGDEHPFDLPDAGRELAQPAAADGLVVLVVDDEPRAAFGRERALVAEDPLGRDEAGAEPVAQQLHVLRVQRPRGRPVRRGVTDLRAVARGARAQREDRDVV